MRKHPIAIILGAIAAFSSLNAASYYCDRCGQYEGSNNNSYGYNDDGFYRQNRNWYGAQSRDNFSDDQNFYAPRQTTRQSNAPWAAQSQFDNQSTGNFQGRFANQGRFDGQGRFANQGQFNNFQAIRDEFDSPEDRQILQRIRERIQQNRNLNVPNVGILVIDKDVIIRGRVNNKDEFSAVEETITGVEGIGNVSNKLRFPGKNKGWFTSGTDDEDQGATRQGGNFFGSTSDTDQNDRFQQRDQFFPNQQGASNFQNRFNAPAVDQGDAAHQQDHQLLSRVRNALERDNVNAFRNVQIRVNEGTILLTGSIPTNKDRQAIKNRIFKIDGVEFIDDRLLLTNDGDQGFAGANSDTAAGADRDDSDLRKEIINQLKGGIFSTGFDNVRAEVVAGKVTLKGNVTSNSDLKTVLDRIQKVKGVRAVDNQITVKSADNN